MHSGDGRGDGEHRGEIRERTRDVHQSHHPLSGNVIASGDDDGCVKIWDTRARTAAAENINLSWIS